MGLFNDNNMFNGQAGVWGAKSNGGQQQQNGLGEQPEGLAQFLQRPLNYQMPQIGPPGANPQQQIQDYVTQLGGVGKPMPQMGAPQAPPQQQQAPVWGATPQAGAPAQNNPSPPAWGTNGAPPGLEMPDAQAPQQAAAPMVAPTMGPVGANPKQQIKDFVQQLRPSRSISW
jgi:hypothetical protein